ncbi:MAG: hypothetical protein ACLQNU_03710, partial [Candidatus Dormibacteria bacterium]
MFLGLDIVIGVVVLFAASRTSVGRRAINVAQQKVTHLLDRAENPVEALDLSYQQQLEELQQVRHPP